MLKHNHIFKLLNYDVLETYYCMFKNKLYLLISQQLVYHNIVK